LDLESAQRQRKCLNLVRRLRTQQTSEKLQVLGLFVWAASEQSDRANRVGVWYLRIANLLSRLFE
jgi:hypothetical protein